MTETGTVEAKGLGFDAPEIVICPEVLNPFDDLNVGDIVEIHYNDKVETFTVYLKNVPIDGSSKIVLSGPDKERYISSYLQLSVEKYEFGDVYEDHWLSISQSIRLFLVRKN